MQPKIAELGSISSGTMRTGDLIQAFTETLENLWPDKAAELHADAEYKAIYEYLDTEKYSEGIGDGWLQDCDCGIAESAVFLSEDLVNSLQECAPEGAYFGTLEGDGAHYGFWEDFEL